MNQYGIEYQVFVGKNGTAIKTKFFKTESARDKFCEKIESDENFIRVLAYTND